MSSSPYNLSRLSETVFKIVEADRFGENPFIYVVVGGDKLALIDTGCDSADLPAFLQQNLPKIAPETSSLVDKILVINTHSHFDHVASNYRFSPIDSALKPFCLGLCAGDMDKNYTLNKENSASDIFGADLKPFSITRWLAEGEKVDLGAPDNFLQVLSIPGHTRDSIALFYPRENRVFVGDFIYRWAAMLAMLAGSDLAQYRQSTKKLIEFSEVLPMQEEVRLCCGHVDEDLEWRYLRDLSSLLEGVAEKKLKGQPVARMPGARIFESPDKSLSFLYREKKD